MSDARQQSLFPTPPSETPAEQPDTSPAQSRRAPRILGPRTFSRRLALAFGTVAALTALLVGLLLSVVWSYQFNKYAEQNLQGFADSMAQTAAVLYPYYGFGPGTLVRLPMLGRSNSVGVQILDAGNVVVYDEASMRRHLQELVQQGGMSMPEEGSTEPTVVLEPRGKVVTSAVTVGATRVGTVRVWAYGANLLLTDRDRSFQRGSLIALTVAGLAAIVLASIAGISYARRLVRPIQTVTATAQALRGGDRGARTGLDSDDEIGFLGKTFDEMADSIEADREMERRLTADVAHELRTPLQAIQATVEAMQDGVLPADEEHLGIVRDETVRLGRLAGGILELTRLERGSVPFRMTRLDMHDPVQTALDAHLAMLEMCDVRVDSSLARGLFVEADHDRLVQAVGNLLSNAARYTPAGGQAEIRLFEDGDCAVVRVSDTGIGISEDDLPHVFSRFWRADSARDRSSGGTGIGLAVTKEIVERHGGTISVARRDGGGTTFSIRLPLDVA